MLAFIYFLLNCWLKLDPGVINRSFSTDFYFRGAIPGPQEQEGQMFGGRAVLQYKLLNEVLM